MQSPQKAAGFEAWGTYNLRLPKFDSVVDVIISISMLSLLSHLLLLSSYSVCSSLQNKIFNMSYSCCNNTQMFFFSSHLLNSVSYKAN